MQHSKMFTRTILRAPVLGEREVCFRSPKLYQHSPIVQQCRIQKFTRRQNHTPRTSVLGECFFFLRKCTKTQLQQCRIKILSRDTRFRGEERLFLFSENEKNSPSVMPNSKFSGGQLNTPDLRVRGEERLFLFSNISRGTIPRTPVLGERKICLCSPKMYHNSPTAMQNSKISRRTIARTFVLGGGGVCFHSLKMY